MEHFKPEKLSLFLSKEIGIYTDEHEIDTEFIISNLNRFLPIGISFGYDIKDIVFYCCMVEKYGADEAYNLCGVSLDSRTFTGFIGTGLVPRPSVIKDINNGVYSRNDYVDAINERRLINNEFPKDVDIHFLEKFIDTNIEEIHLNVLSQIDDHS